MSKEQSLEAHTDERGTAAATQAPTPRQSSGRKMPGGRSWAALWLAITLALVAAFGLSSGLAQASAARPDANAITITSETQSDTYPSQMTFQVQASDNAGTISGAQLEIAVPQINVDHQITVPVPQPGATVSLTYRYDPSSDYLPPFTLVTYHWTLSDNAQHSLTGTDQHFDFVDTRFSWRHLTQGELSVYWYNQNTAYGQNILNTASQEATSIEHDLNGTLTAPVRVLVYATAQDLRGGLPPNAPNWAGGVALIQFDEALIVVGDAQYPLQRDLPHELTHLIFHEIAGLDCGGCPLWFDEGMAVYHQIYHEPELQATFNDAVRRKALLPFNSIVDQFPQDSNQAELAYAQSWNFIKYLYSTYTQPKVAQLVDALKTTPFADAFQQAFGRSVAQMEDQWRVSLGLQPINNSPASTPSTGGASSSQPSAAAPNEGNGSGPLTAIGLGLVLLLLAGMVGAVFIMRRSRQAPAPATGAPWPLQAPGAPASFAPMSQQPGYQPGAQPTYAPPATPQGIPTDQRYRQKIEQRQALLRRINELIDAEKRLDIQRAEIERQIALYAAQERQARSEQSQDRAMLALDRRQKLETHIPYLQRQLEQARAEKSQALEMERHISAEIDAAFSQQAMQPASPPNPDAAWPQQGSQIPAPARWRSQE